MKYYVTGEKSLSEMDKEILDILCTSLHKDCNIILIGKKQFNNEIIKLSQIYNIPYIFED